MATSALNQLLETLSSNKNLQSLLSSITTVATELKNREADLKEKFESEKEATLKKAYTKYNGLVKTIGQSEAKFEKELNSVISKIKKSAAQLEKNIESYKKKAIEQSKKLEKTLAQKAGVTKKSSKKVSTKKTTTKKAATKPVATKKTTKKTSKKASSK